MKKMLLIIVFLVTFVFAHGHQEGQKMDTNCTHCEIKQSQQMPQMFQTVAEDKVEIHQKGDAKMYCPVCGMYLPKFYKTSHMVKLKDGEVRQYCSLHCLIEEQEVSYLRDKKDNISQILVVDTDTLKYIDVKEAHYVVGSKIAGTMSAVSQYAFATREGAQNFANTNGGTLMSYEEAYQATMGDFSKDVAMIHKNRSDKMYKAGEMLYSTVCDKQKIDTIQANTIGELKGMINTTGVCGANLADKDLQAISLYYWDIKMNKFEQTHGKH